MNDSWCNSMKSQSRGYSTKELALNEKLSTLGFEHNNFERCFLFDGVRKYPDYINEEKNMCLSLMAHFGIAIKCCTI